MAKDSDNKSKEVLEAERNGGQVFDPTADEGEQLEERQDTEESDEVLEAGKCPDCKGAGIKSPTATQVCQTCQGTGKA